MAAPLIKRVRVLAAKAETTPGTAEALTATEAAFNVFNAAMQQEAEIEERQQQGGFAMLPSVVGARKGRLIFSSHLYGHSAQPAWAALFLPAVGLGFSSTKYLLDALPPEASGSTQETLTLGLYQNGKLKKIWGAMGNMKLELPAGKLARADFDFLGKWAAPTDVAILAPIYPTLAPLRVVSAALTIGTTWPKAANVSIDLGNQLYLREDVSEATGYSSCVIASRLVKGTVNLEAGLVATKDVYGDWLAGTEASFSVVCAAGSDTVTISGTKLQFTSPKEGDRNGLETDEIEFQMNADDLEMLFA